MGPDGPVGRRQVITVRIHMTGSEWFGALHGGLNRYFEDLFVAMRDDDRIDVSAAAFGEAVEGGESWRGLDDNLFGRLRTSRRGLPQQPDVLDRHFTPYGPSGRSANASVVVSHFHGPWFLESIAGGQTAWRASLKRTWERRRHAEADRAIVLCAEFGRILNEQFHYPADRIQVIPPGVNLLRFQKADPQETSRPLVLCVRRLERRMGVDVLLDAWKAVVAAVPDALLGIVGEGPEQEVLRAQVDFLNLGRSVIFYGRVPDDELRARYTEAVMTVVPTRMLEGFGLIALESLAMGRPVVVTRTGGLPDAVRGLDPSLIVEPEDARQLADRLVLGLEGSVPSASTCRQHAETFAWDRVVDRHIALYRELLS